MSIDWEERLHTYNKPHCWQYDIRLNNLNEDLKQIQGVDYTTLTVKDFVFKQVTSTQEKALCKEFIERHEWLGTLSQYTTHWFAAYYKDIIAGVILFNMPNAFSKILGDKTVDLERLISRGACISWSPKNLASCFLMWCIDYMVKNTQYRVFTAYSDPTAKEVGTIYQACNFYYMGQSAGGTKKYVNPYTGKFVSDRYFRQKTAYKKFAEELGIVWGSDWNHATGMNWDNVPEEYSTLLKEYSKKMQSTARCVTVPYKHKYVYILGQNKKETKELRREYEHTHKILPYPKERGV